MDNRVIVRSLMIICITIALGCVLASCGKDEKTKKEIGDQHIDEFMKMFAKPDQEAVALLSLKYDLQPSLVEDFLDRYLTDIDTGYKFLKETLKPSKDVASKPDEMGLIALEKERYYQALEKASQSVGVPLKTAVLLVLDYKMLTARNREDD